MDREILILDDEPRFRRAVRYALKGGNYTCFEAETVREGAELIAERAGLRVILLDLSLPGAAGPELLTRLDERREKYRVIVFTGHEEILDAQEAGELEVFAYHIKGRTFGEQALRFTVEQAFRDIEREQLHKKGRAHLEIAKLIHDLEVAPSEHSEDNLNMILDLICAKILEVTEAYTCHIRTIDLERGDLELRACRGPAHFLEVASLFNTRKSPGRYFSGAVASNGAPLVEDKIQQVEAFRAMKAKFRDSNVDAPDLREYFENIQAAYIVPITTRLFDKNPEGKDRVDAVINISSDRVDFFDESRCEIIQEFVSQAGLAITKFWLADKQYELHQNYKMIGDMLGLITKEVEATGDLDKILEIVSREVSRSLNAELLTIFLLNEDTQLLEVAAEFRGGKFISDVAGTQEVYEKGEALTGRVFADRKSLRIPKYRGEASRPDDDPLVRGKSYSTDKLPSGEVKHYLGTPIQIGDQLLGVLRALNKKSRYYDERTPQDDLALLERGFSPDSENILEIAARHLASVIKNSRLILILKTLNAVGAAIRSEMGVEDLLESIVRICAQSLGAQICMLFLKDESGDEMTLRKSQPPLPFEGWSYRVNEGATGRVVSSGEPRLEREIDADRLGKYDRELDEYIRQELGGDGIQSRLMVPIVAKSRVVGVIKLTNRVRTGELFGSSELELLRIVADQIGVAIENARLYDLRSSYLNNIITNSPDPIIALNAKGKIAVFNQAAEQVLGYDPDFAKNASAEMIYESLSEAKRIGGLLHNATDGRIRDVRAKMRHRSGSILPVNLAASLLYSEGG